MPTRQDTFKLVPTTLVNKTAPRPPMTSKAAKKAYREATKLPKISKAEQRRIEAAEIAAQKKEYEKERAAAKAKAAKEKKLKKEAEERAKRKELGLPEPSRFVRPSQPSIKTFVKSAGGRKRSREEVNNSKEGDGVDTAVDVENDESQLEQPIENPAKRVALKQVDDDDEFGDFPSLSQADLPTLFAEPEDTPQPASSNTSPNKSSGARPQSQSIKRETVNRFSMADQIKPDNETVGSQEAMPARTTPPSMCECQHSTFSRAISSSCEITTILSAGPCSTARKPQVQEMTTPVIQVNGPRKIVDERTRSMPPPAVPTTINGLGPLNPLSEVSRNMAPPPRLPRVQAVSSIRPKTRSEKRSGQEHLSMPPPSTLAFLEAHLDEFFPSPSQQVRELLEEVDDMPSNTQIAREIDLDEQDCTPVRIPHVPRPLPQSQIRIEDETLHFLSSQDLEISSQDLRDIDTPSKATHKGSLSRDCTTQIRAPAEVVPISAPTPKLKPRFFEEKEGDILHAVLQESLLLSKQTTQSSSPRRSQRIFHRTQSAKTNNSYNDYGSDGSDLDADLLALLDDP